MISIIIALLIGAVSITFFIYFYNYFKTKGPAAQIKINIMDFKKNNYYDVITIKILKKGIIKKLTINSNTINFTIDGFNNKGILKCELNLINSDNSNEKHFKINIYKKFINVINININNKSDIYYNSEIIFYCEGLKPKINKDNLEISNYNLVKRYRLLIYNSNEDVLTNIIRDNNNDKDLQNKAIETIKKNHNKLLLLNIYIGKNKQNILIFIDENKSLIVPSKKEKQIFEQFYLQVYKYRLNSYYLDILCESCKNEIINQKEIFNEKISNFDDQKNIKIYFSFMNQGVNCLFENNIISKDSSTDYHFILGYMLFYVYITNKQLSIYFLSKFFLNLEVSKHYSYADLIRIVVSYIMFSINSINIIDIKFTNELKENDPYNKAFEFFKNIIMDLDENSDLIFIYLQLNSGYGLDLLNNKKCFKITMQSIEDIKLHIIENIPKYFFIYNENKNNYIATDSRTQVMVFNENKLFDKTSNNYKKNNIMNITLGMFHESGHIKFHKNTEIGGDHSPLLCINKRFEFVEKLHWDDNKRGESGKFIDYFLYDSTNEEAVLDLISSFRTNELMNKNYFTGDLKLLNSLSNRILTETVKNNQKINTENNNLNNLSTLSCPKFENNINEKNKYKRLKEIGCDIDY